MKSHNSPVSEAMRFVIRSLSDRNLAVTLKLGDRVFSFSASEHGEKQR